MARGPGSFSTMLISNVPAAHGIGVAGLDLVDDLLVIGQQCASEGSVDVTFMQGDMTAFDNGTAFDGAWSYSGSADTSTMRTT